MLYTVTSANYLPTFRDSLSVSSSNGWRWDLRVVPKRPLLSTNLRCVHNPEERTSHLHRSDRATPHTSRVAAIVDAGRTAGGWLSGPRGSGRGVLWSEKRNRQTAGGLGRGTWPAIYMEKDHFSYGKISAPVCLKTFRRLMATIVDVPHR